MSNKEEISLQYNTEKNNIDIFSEEQKQNLVEKIINKWLNLQKTIKEEITLEDVIIKQQQDDTNNLKSFFRKYYQTKLNTRKNWADINSLILEDKESNISSYLINEDIGPCFHDASEPIKNLFFILRNNYDYLKKLISLIKPEDFIKNSEKINSLVELLNNNFYENILIPNPEQKEFLILVYKLLENEIISMGCINQENFLKDNSFIGIFLNSFAKKQEILGYFSMILNPLILSIDDDDSKDYFDMSINNIIRNIDLNQINKKSVSRSTSIENKKLNLNINIKEYLFNEIPKTKIKFKNSFELVAEKEKEDELNYVSTEEFMSDSDKNIIYISKKRRTIIQKNRLNFGNTNEYNNEYKYDINQKWLIEKIDKENDREMKKVYSNLLEQLNNYPNKFTNEGLLRILKMENDKRNILIEVYKENFIYIRDTLEELLQSLVDKIITMPYPLRCICKMIYILISKKSPGLTKYEINAFIGKFILDKCIIPILSLENKIFINQRVYSEKAKTCLDIIISILSKANNSSLFDTYLDPENTIFNQLILEIIPILNKFYEKVIDIQLPKVIEDLITKISKILSKLPSRRIFNFRHKKNGKDLVGEKVKSKHDLQSQTPLYEYFKENPDEILHLQSVCFNVNDILFLLELIGRNMDSFKDLPRFSFFSKTYKKIKNEEKVLNELIEEDNFNLRKTFYVIFKDEKNNILDKLIKQKRKDSTFENNEQDSELVFRRVKFCIKTILKGLNLLNNKDFAYLNFAQSSDKFFSALKYTLEELGEYSGELSNDIPLKWYSQYIYNYKKELDIEYQKEDFNKLYSDISSEENNILNELKELSNKVITRDGMNLRCAEKKLEKAMYELKLIVDSKKYNQLERFIKTKTIEVCVNQSDESLKTLNTEKELPVNITELKLCPFGNSSNEKNDKNHSHLKNINDFIKLIASNNKIRLKSYIRETIFKGENKYKIPQIMEKYMELVNKKIKENKSIFGELNDEQIKEFSKNIENHIIRKIYKYIYPPNRSEIDYKIKNDTKSLEWIQPENMEIKKLYINQLKFAEKYINKMNEAKSVFDKLNCIENAYVIMNNTVKFISGKNENAGQDELTPLFQYILIKSQPERLSTNINYIKCFLSEDDSIGKNGFYCSQMESALEFILNIKGSDLKMNNEEFNKKRELHRKMLEEKDKNKNIYKFNNPKLN